VVPEQNTNNNKGFKFDKKFREVSTPYPILVPVFTHPEQSLTNVNKNI